MWRSESNAGHAVMLICVLPFWVAHSIHSCPAFLSPPIGPGSTNGGLGCLSTDSYVHVYDRAVRPAQDASSRRSRLGNAAPGSTSDREEGQINEINSRTRPRRRTAKGTTDGTRSLTDRVSNRKSNVKSKAKSKRKAKRQTTKRKLSKLSKSAAKRSLSSVSSRLHQSVKVKDEAFSPSIDSTRVILNDSRAPKPLSKGKLLSRSSASKSFSGKVSKKSSKKSTEKFPNATKSPSFDFQRAEMMDHDMLTKEQELILGRNVVKARKLRDEICFILEEKEMQRQLQLQFGDTDSFDAHDADQYIINESNGDESSQQLDYDFLSYELDYLSLYGFRPSDVDDMTQQLISSSEHSTRQTYSSPTRYVNLGDHAQHKQYHLSQLKRPTTSVGTSSSNTAPFDAKTAPLLDLPLHLLTSQDIASLNLSSRPELIQILSDGAYAREVLMRQNVKLVMSIAKNWMKRTYAVAASNAGINNEKRFQRSISRTASRSNSAVMTLAQLYEGGWDRPSLDEAMQEGMLGLARAVDKYDPERGWRFSTYATHWITSYVRICFQRAATGCLKVPSQLHDIKAAYNKILKEHITSGESTPSQKKIASQLGISEQRLTTAIRATGVLLSVDAPMISPGSGSFKGSAAGGDGSHGSELLISDTLRCAEPKPEDQVEISFLRQCLENAMATELTPYERDILRLRLGLDSGEGKTVREVVEICGGSVTMNDVRTAERRAFKKLRSPASVHTHNLLAYLDLAGADKRLYLQR